MPALFSKAIYVRSPSPDLVATLSFESSGASSSSSSPSSPTTLITPVSTPPPTRRRNLLELFRKRRSAPGGGNTPRGYFSSGGRRPISPDLTSLCAREDHASMFRKSAVLPCRELDAPGVLVTACNEDEDEEGENEPAPAATRTNNSPGGDHSKTAQWTPPDNSRSGLPFLSVSPSLLPPALGGRAGLGRGRSPNETGRNENSARKISDPVNTLVAKASYPGFLTPARRAPSLPVPVLSTTATANAPLALSPVARATRQREVAPMPRVLSRQRSAGQIRQAGAAHLRRQSSSDLRRRAAQVMVTPAPVATPPPKASPSPPSPVLTRKASTGFQSRPSPLGPNATPPPKPAALSTPSRPRHTRQSASYTSPPRTTGGLWGDMEASPMSTPLPRKNKTGGGSNRETLGFSTGNTAPLNIRRSHRHHPSEPGVPSPSKDKVGGASGPVVIALRNKPFPPTPLRPEGTSPIPSPRTRPIAAVVAPPSTPPTLPAMSATALSPLFGTLATAMRANDDFTLMMAEMAILGTSPSSPTPVEVAGAPLVLTFPVSRVLSRRPEPDVPANAVDSPISVRMSGGPPSPVSTVTPVTHQRQLSRHSLLERRRNVQSITHDYLEVYTEEGAAAGGNESGGGSSGYGGGRAVPTPCEHGNLFKRLSSVQEEGYGRGEAE